jgi:hypothetical protein
MVKPHLYILVFNDDEHFKLGISLAPNQNRMIKHISTYNVDVSKSLVVSCEDKNSIKLLEKNLKHITSKVITEDSTYYGLDGHTEIRKNEQLEEVMSIIDMFKPILGLTVEELKLNEKSIKVKNECKHIKYDVYDNEKSLFVIDNIVRYLLDNITSAEIMVTDEKYLMVTVDLSTKFNDVYDVFDFIEPIHSDFFIYHMVEHKTQIGQYRLDDTGVFRITGGGTTCSNDCEVVMFSFLRYFPHRDLNLFIDENSTSTPINVIMDKYDELMQLLVDTNKNKKNIELSL